MCALIRVKLDEKWREKQRRKLIVKSELSEMARTMIEKSGECRVLACADTGSEDPRWRAPVLHYTYHILTFPSFHVEVSQGFAQKLYSSS